jgi:hypothetical protein
MTAKKEYPHACCRCGACCLSEQCRLSILIYGSMEKCPALTFDASDIATCALAEKGIVPIGDGCCIKASAFKDGVEYDFASLPADIKRIAALDIKKRRWL